MNPPRNQNDIDLLNNLAASTPHLDALPPEDLNALADIFRISVSNPGEVLQRVRRILLEVLALEREQFAAYLQLPKFKTLPARAISALQLYWAHLWTVFCAAREQEAKAQPPPVRESEGDRVTPYAITNAEGLKEGPRMAPFDYYRPYQPYPKFGLDQHKLAFSPFPYYYNFQNYGYPSPYHTQPTLPRYTNTFSREEPRTENDKPESPPDKIEKPEKSEKVEKTDKPDRAEKAKKDKPDKSQKGEKTEKPEKVDKMDKTEKASKPDASKSKAKSHDSNSEDKMASSSKLPSKKQQQPEPSNGKQVELPRSNIINLRFLHCACLGHTINTSEKSFECQECKNLFHFSCLHLPPAQGKSCPLCTLTRNHIFTEALPRTIKSGWFEVGHKECFVTKLQLDEDELGIFRRYMGMLAEKEKEGVHSIEFRILRINEKAKVKPGRKIIKTSFPLLMGELRKIETRHWIELKLKQITEPSLIFYIMAMIRLKDKPRLLQDYLALEQRPSLPESWLQHELTAGKKAIVSLLHPVSRRIIELPVRGEFCEHLECEDLIYLYELFQSSAFEANNRLQCSHCKKAYTAHSKFTADPVLYEMLKNRPPNATKVRCENGRLEWMPFDPRESPPEEEELSESGSSS